jgi:hypothetical protein
MLDWAWPKDLRGRRNAGRKGHGCPDRHRLRLCAGSAGSNKVTPQLLQVEVDKKIDQIRRDLIARIPTPEQIEALLGPVYSKTDVDQKLNQLSAAIPQQTVSLQDLDKALQQTVSRQDFDKAMQQTVSRQDLNEAIAGATDSAKAREKAIDDKLPWMPAWVPPLVSFLGVMISGGLAYYIASKAREPSGMAKEAVDARIRELMKRVLPGPTIEATLDEQD